jgi:hypothetical protein
MARVTNVVTDGGDGGDGDGGGRVCGWEGRGWCGYLLFALLFDFKVRCYYYCKCAVVVGGTLNFLGRFSHHRIKLRGG